MLLKNVVYIMWKIKRWWNVLAVDGPPVEKVHWIAGHRDRQQLRENCSNAQKVQHLFLLRVLQISLVKRLLLPNVVIAAAL